MTEEKALDYIERVTSIAENLAFLGSSIAEKRLKQIPLTDDQLARMIDAFRGELSSLHKLLKDADNYLTNKI